MSVISTQGFTFRLLAGEPLQQLDIFEDEDYVISNNVTGLFDIGLLPSDFTRQITLPGTKVNNAFFQHCYDISITNPFIFATNQKVPALFDFDSVYVSQGYMQLNKVNVRANKFIDSYEVTIYGSLSSLGRDLNRVYLTDLNSLSKYNHTSSYDNISASWNGNLFNGDIVYPLADYGSGWQFTSGQYELFGVDDQNGALSVQNFKPAIKVKKVWDAIFEEAGYTYTSSFFNEAFLDNVYMICNYGLKYPTYSDVNLETYGKIKIGAISGSGMVDVDLPSGSWVTLPWQNKIEDQQNFYNNTSYRVDKQTNILGILNLNINVSCSVNNMPGTLAAGSTWQIRMLETGSSTPYSVRAIQSFIFFFDQLQQSRTGGINQNYELQTEFKMDDIPTGSYYFQIRQTPNNPSIALPTVTLDPNGTTKSYLQIKQVNQAADGKVIDIAANMPYGTTGIKQIDFITGLQKKFNLVIYPDKTKANQFVIETFNNWYNRGEVKDFNKYINLDEIIEVVPANNLAVNKLNFGDTLDTDYISQQFAKGANREFGKQYYTDTTNYYSQGELNVKTTFASSPLIKIAGTGLSGSVEGLNPTITAYYAGNCRVYWGYGATDTCLYGTLVDVYTTSGQIEQGLIAYTNPYGTSYLTNLRWISNPVGGEIYSLNLSNGEIGYGSGFFC